MSKKRNSHVVHNTSHLHQDKNIQDRPVQEGLQSSPRKNKQLSMPSLSPIILFGSYGNLPGPLFHWQNKTPLSKPRFGNSRNGRLNNPNIGKMEELIISSIYQIKPSSYGFTIINFGSMCYMMLRLSFNIYYSKPSYVAMYARCCMYTISILFSAHCYSNLPVH